MYEGETLALLGESGSGKSTLLRIICGLEIPDSGELRIGGKLFNSDKTHVKPENRNIGLVFQDNALFPHLSVAGNIAFGLKRGAKASVLTELMETTKLKGLEKRMPHELSGGQQQRVALARALATNPQLLLLDEPFSTLDHSLKNEIRAEIKEVIRSSGKSCIIVTHHMDDATSMADRIAILQDGKMIQTGTPRELYESPVNTYVAKLFGTINTIDGKVVRAENIEVGTGDHKAMVEESYFENGHYILHLRYNGDMVKALSHSDVAVGEGTSFAIKKELHFSSDR